MVLTCIYMYLIADPEATLKGGETARAASTSPERGGASGGSTAFLGNRQEELELRRQL
eukprot:CAMPEP_0177460402 /NCGR_PEP_ID=MMETSP0369-20130122/14645_1 /TAXON_ID=447022 ORGANISM="Scrippsiella hangoei-like, Strain SHHI-4" /NCGR_SAMPLE_ID=MMETSP0369 /ASSEMBLY_ACC=CAM_ASM_000364 /LENGTH=57 /DNA_ID=CAMNT_0018933785 /DNA_START=121 /DNA_END=291 /DNA_ORIENTATION=+